MVPGETLINDEKGQPNPDMAPKSPMDYYVGKFAVMESGSINPGESLEGQAEEMGDYIAKQIQKGLAEHAGGIAGYTKMASEFNKFVDFVNGHGEVAKKAAEKVLDSLHSLGESQTKNRLIESLDHALEDVNRIVQINEDLEKRNKSAEFFGETTQDRRAREALSRQAEDLKMAA